MTGSAPILALCRKLLEADHDPDQSLAAYRGDTLALRVRSIGKAANLEIDGKGCGFKHRAAVGIGPSIAKSGSVYAGRRATPKATPRPASVATCPVSGSTEIPIVTFGDVTMTSRFNPDDRQRGG
jgi:hypothetical protein